MQNVSIKKGVEITPESIKHAAKNWRQYLAPEKLKDLQNIAHQIDDISTTDQIYK